MVVRIIHRKKDISWSETTSPNTNSPTNSTSFSTESKSWITTSVTASKPKTRRAKAEPIVVNAVFKACEDLTVDPTWKTIFSEAAYGKLPRGFTYKNGYLTHKIRNKISRLELSSTDPQVVMEECMRFMKEKAGIMSQEDQRKAKEEFEEHLIQAGNLRPNQWSEIKKKKKIRNVLLSTFITQLSKEMALTQTEKEDLRNKIFLGLILGCFGNEQIEVKDGYITNIAGLVFDPATRHFSIDYSKAPKQLKKSRRSDKDKAVVPKTSFYLLWIKFLESLEHHVVKGGHQPTPQDPDSSDALL
jgi:hypothetical protein